MAKQIQQKNKAPLKQLQQKNKPAAKLLTNGKNKAPLKQARNSAIKGVLKGFKSFIGGK